MNMRHFVLLTSIALGSPLLVAHSSIAAATKLLPYQEVTTASQSGHVVLAVGAGDMTTSVPPQAQVSATHIYPAQVASFALKGGAADPFDPASGRSKVLWLPSPSDRAWDMPIRYVSVIAETLAETSPGVLLYVGKDRNFDGRPQLDESICQSDVVATSPVHCVVGQDELVDVLAVGGQAPVWVMAVAPATPNASFTANVSGILLGQFASPFYNIATGPDHVAAGEPFSLRVSYASLLPGRYYGAAIVAGPDTLNQKGANIAVLPFSITRTALGEDQSASPIVVAPRPFGSQGTAFALRPGESMRRAFFDLPLSSSAYDPITFKTSARSPSGTAPNVDVTVVRTEFPTSQSDAAVIPAPADAMPAAHWKVTSANVVQGALANPASGRWFVVATNQDSQPAMFSVDLSDGKDPTSTTFGHGENPTIASGQYFNPQRSGHGISISRGGDRQMLVWYSYIEDGTPAWYEADAPAPAADSGWWTAPLSLFTWNGTSASPTQVGFVELVPTATNKFMFNWQLEGQAGSEAFEMLAPDDACPRLDGALTNLSGNWFAPAQSGYGVDVLALPDHQVELYYLYDDLGLARWVYGGAAFAPTSTMDMVQISGFCPTCAYIDITTQSVGVLKMSFADVFRGAFQTTLNLRSPLSGSWNINQPIMRLTGKATCSP